MLKVNGTTEEMKNYFEADTMTEIADKVEKNFAIGCVFLAKGFLKVCT